MVHLKFTFFDKRPFNRSWLWHRATSVVQTSENVRIFL